MNTNVILGGLALVLAIPTAMTVIAERASFTDFDRVPYLFDGFRPENIARISLSKDKVSAREEESGAAATTEEGGAATKTAGILFQRHGDGWVLASDPAFPTPLAGVPIQRNKIETEILDHLQHIRLDRKSRIAEDVSPEELNARGLSKEKGLHIICFNAEGNAIAHLIRGDDASGGGQWAENQVRGFYVRPKNRNDIVLYEPNLGFWYLGLNDSDWIDLKIHNFPARNTERFTVRNAKGAVSVVREESTGDRMLWRVEAGPEGVGELRQQEVANMVQRFNFINCTRYLGRINDPAWGDKVPGDDAKVMVSATLEDGSVYTMWVGDKIPATQEDDARFAGPAGPLPFLVALGEWDRTPFERNPTELFEPALPGGREPPPGEPDPGGEAKGGADNGGAAANEAPTPTTPVQGPEAGEPAGEKPDTSTAEPKPGSGAESKPTGKTPKGS